MTRRLLRARSTVLLTVLVGMLATISACQKSDANQQKMPHVGPSQISQYVAMGDSFVSGPAISPETKDSGICLRSERNYPHLLTKALDIPQLTDVSCAGASTYHLLNDVTVPGSETVKAQVDSLTDGTKLVTVGIGYNNDLIFTNLLAACQTGKDAPAKGACQGFVADEVPDLLKKERDDVVDALETIRRRAPNATVLVVGYLPLLPEPDVCPDSVLQRDNQRSVYDVEVGVDDNLRAAAAAAGVEFVSMRETGRGHGMCAGDDAWVNGADAAPGDGVVVHPRAVGMKAVARVVAEKLRTYQD